MGFNQSVDVIVIGAGAAGMMCAAQAGQRGRRVVLVDHAEKRAEKIRISGGGRCNFTNLNVSAANFLSSNPHFCRSALARYTPQDFIALVQRHGIRYHEKTLGQLFCDESSAQIIEMLERECADGQVHWAQPARVLDVAHEAAAGYRVRTDRGEFDAPSLVIATGGLSIPKIGATDFGYRIAHQFDIPVVTPRPALVPLTLDRATLDALAPLAGVAFTVEARCGDGRFREQALVTHKGLSGPAILQISSYWQAACAAGHPEPVVLDLFAGDDADAWLDAHANSNALPGNLLAERLPRRFARAWAQLQGAERALAQMSERERQALAQALSHWALTPSGTQGFAKAEVTLGGVDTRALSSKTMAATARPGLYFIGEVVDVTGHLGGYNFQWAWASGHAAAQAL
ncbi:NAD(P)/FAD-dependent oxidoreductase [Nitrogeniibacter mangrovi]|uniref:NAD(P)/FAD-dependent oxidoreductase n=1 Tax=Nitrogeniibacter mangrovi TaxID=2016596 RepID=A0A6C1B2M4_9RHOO|nr:NAD(P)/FAD-dependent oxidoreductase [Nitrogeniibacter mangrovi]QID17892.1 NAD(P)/FAD-dependent oxidoreductase [Nitrogeniibacter mangrovi]